MLPTQDGALRLFRVAGISVYLHWSWFLVAVYVLRGRSGAYPSLAWNVAEYMALFGIVLLHEFGHALACRSVGGRAEQIILWPLGGVAYVRPPQRAGATLWSIAAGPLVNVVLFCVLTAALVFGPRNGLVEVPPAAWAFVHAVWVINLVLLLFNLLPIYPLDGGQMLRSLLWFVLGRARSLIAATGIGFVGVAALIGLAVWLRSVWLGILAAFALVQCWRGWQQAWLLLQLGRMPRRGGFACPVCSALPLAGAYWRCGGCGAGFDLFLTDGQCPQCGSMHGPATCADCGETRPLAEWRTQPAGGVLAGH